MSDLRRVRRTWEHLGRTRPMFAVLTYRSEWDEAEFFATGEAEVAEVMSYLRGLGLEVGREAALDFGCGLGRLTRALAGHFIRVTGVDIAEQMIAQARELNDDVPGCEFVHNVRPDLAALGSESFDFVYSNITFQHMPWQLARGYIAECVRVLRPGGVLVFQLPTAPRDTHDRSRIIAALLRARAVVGVAWRLGRRHMEMHCTPAEEVRRYVTSAGGTVVDVKPDERANRRWDSLRYTVIAASSSPTRP